MAKYDALRALSPDEPLTPVERRATHLTFSQAKGLILDALWNDAGDAEDVENEDLVQALDQTYDAATLFCEGAACFDVHGRRYVIEKRRQWGAKSNQTPEI
mgnify:CR=1 FL=1